MYVHVYERCIRMHYLYYKCVHVRVKTTILILVSNLKTYFITIMGLYSGFYQAGKGKDLRFFFYVLGEMKIDEHQ